MNKRVYYFLIIIVIILGGGALLWLRGLELPDEVDTTGVNEMKKLAEPEVEMRVGSDISLLQAADIPNVSDVFQFASVIPMGWQTEAVPAIGAINIYDPSDIGKNNLEKSQIFIRSFSASDFLTLSTVTILKVDDFTINERPTRQYLIRKKPEVPPFPNQPAWRNEEHVVTDVRVSDKNPSVFYVIAKRPDLDGATYQRFLDNLAVVAETTTSLIEPTEEFLQRISKKPFGVFVTSETSPPRDKTTLQ